MADDPGFQEDWRKVKRQNKERLAGIIKELTEVTANPHSIFDIQVKRIHEYKRQLLNILHVIYCWVRLKEDSDFTLHPRTFIFGGKAAPGYTTAKQIIRLICHVAEMINRDRSTNEFIKVVFIPNYRVSLAERIFPAADVSEQISTAGYEASGTSNMKFALNGALTVGTMDGANIEIKDAVGEENIFIFGHTAEEVANMAANYNPMEICQSDPLLKNALDLIWEGFFSPETPDTFADLVDLLQNRDRFQVMADFHSYLDCQTRVNQVYADPVQWTRKAILNTARMGFFSSDRTIFEYNRDIWHAEPVKIIKDNQEVPAPDSKQVRESDPHALD